MNVSSIKENNFLIAAACLMQMLELRMGEYGDNELTNNRNHRCLVLYKRHLLDYMTHGMAIYT